MRFIDFELCWLLVGNQVISHVVNELYTEFDDVFCQNCTFFDDACRKNCIEFEDVD